MNLFSSQSIDFQEKCAIVAPWVAPEAVFPRLNWVCMLFFHLHIVISQSVAPSVNKE